jgi:hypothetical protein
MRLAALRALFAALFALNCLAHAAAQSAGTLRIAEAGPYDRAVPGQIIELRVEGFDERLITPPPGEALRILLTQDGSTLTARARTASPTMVRESRAAPDGGVPVMKPYQSLTFVVPRGLHAGEAEVVVSYRGRKSAPFKLNIVERPGRPIVGTTRIVSMTPASLPPPPIAGTAATRSSMGLRFERGSKGVEIYVRPLADPEDAEAGVVVRFKQGGAFYDAGARVIHHEGGREDMPNGGFRLMPTRDVLQIDVPEMLAPGEAEMEVSLRAAGQTSDPVLVPVTVTDAERAFESPKETAPRVLAVTPRRLGAGQALMISVDRRRALDPDPDKTVVIFETPDGAQSFKAKPEKMSAARAQVASPDAPVLLIVRAPKQITGDVRVRVHNPARADYEGASSESAQVEIVSETIAPEVQGVGEASTIELSQLRQISLAQSADPRVRPAYEQGVRYVSIRATGLDPDPKYLRVRMEQEGRGAVTLERGDFALFTGNALIVRVPRSFGPGTVTVSVENRGSTGYSTPVVKTFELSARP